VTAKVTADFATVTCHCCRCDGYESAGRRESPPVAGASLFRPYGGSGRVTEAFCAQVASAPSSARKRLTVLVATCVRGT